MKKSNYRKSNRISLTIEEIREIVRQEIEAEKARNNASAKPMEKVWADLRRSSRMPEGWLSRPIQRKPTLSPTDDNELKASDSGNSGMKHIPNGENQILDEAVIYELKAQIVKSVVGEINHELTKSITKHLEFMCKRYQEAGKKDGISSIILLPLPQSRE